MHEKPLYYVYAGFVAILLVTMLYPVIGDDEVSALGIVNFDIKANGTTNVFINVGSGGVAVNFTAVTLPGSPYQPEWYNWTIYEKNNPLIHNTGQIDAPENWYEHTFTSPGLYGVRCIAYNGTATPNHNVKDKDIGFVTAYIPLVANFTNTTTTGVLPLSVTFTDNSTGGPTSFAWQLNDGGANKSVRSPTTSYSTNGTKIINLTVWNTSYNSSYCLQGNCDPLRDSMSRPIEIVSKQGIITRFYTDISTFTGQAKGQVPLALQFTDNSTGDPTDIFSSRAWTFGDGNTSTDTNPTHTYYTPGLYPVSLNVTGLWSSNKTTRQEYVNAYLPISANFSFTSGGTCEPPVFPALYNFVANQTKPGHSNPDKFNWSFDDGTSNATMRNPSHVFNLPGLYNVTLTTLNTTHDITASEMKQIQITGLYANFTANPMIGYQETTGQVIPVTFTSNATDVFGATYYHWEFGNGGSSIQPNAQTTYNRPGDYIVNFTVGNSCNEFNSTQKTIRIIERPIGNFAYAPKYGTFPLEVQFTDLTTDAPNQWEWSFGDGTPNVTVQNPKHTYAAPGDYWVTLTVRNTTVFPIWTHQSQKLIQLSPGINAAFSANRTLGASPLTVQFTDESNPASLVTNWTWNFGDSSPVSREQNPVHTFYGADVYTVNLTVWNSTTGARGSAEHTIDVVEPVVAEFMPNRTVRMNASVGVQFTDLSRGNITDWLWDFGDESPTSDEQNPLHIFPEFKEYPVNLTVWNSYYADVDSIEYNLNVTEMRAPVAGFTADPLVVNVQDPVYFTSQVQGPDIETYFWNFGDGQTSGGTNPSHQYQFPGKYDVSLTVTSPWGQDTETKHQYISVRGLIPNFETIPDTWAIVNTPVTFIDTSRGSPVQWQWDYGDGTIETTANPTTTHSYASAGVYTINMTATNWEPRTASIPKQIRIENRTVPQNVDFEVPGMQYSGTHPFYVQFEDTTPFQSNVTEWFWEFGDGSNSFERAPNHTYQNPGQYTVTLTVRNDAGTNEKRRVAYVVVV